MSHTGKLPGSFPKNVNPFGGGSSFVAIDFAPSGFLVDTIVDRTPGVFAAVQLGAQPTMKTGWNILGFSVQIRLAAVFTGSGLQFWARQGNVWAGILVNGRIPPSPTPITPPSWPPAEFPNDMSTFAQVWNGETDPIRVIEDFPTLMKVDTNYELIALTTMLPLPQQVEPGAQLGFAVVMMPSIMSRCLCFVLRSVDFSVIYEQL